MVCSRCGKRRRRVAHVPMPLTGELRALCLACFAPAFLEHMGRLIAHG